MISKTALESLPHQCETPNCNYKRLKNREYFRARLADLPANVMFLPTKSRGRRTGFSVAAVLKAHETQEARPNASTA